MPARTRFIAILVASTLLFSGGGISLCTGCGEEKMDCCDTPSPASQQLSTKSCCEFRVTSAPETKPAVVGPGGPSVKAPRAALAGVEPLVIALDATGTLLVQVIHPPPGIDDLPLFLLNASLRR